MRRRVVLDQSPVTVLDRDEAEDVPRVQCPRCGQQMPTRDGIDPVEHGRPDGNGRTEPCR
ncbi:MAG: hypothetical protein ACRDMV_10870 [Streptosporangiales bacterium]